MKELNTNTINDSGLLQPLFPNYFKKIGVAVLVSIVVCGIVLRTQHIAIAGAQRGVMRYLGVNFLIFGMALIALARDRYETEVKRSLRLQCIVLSFIMAIVSVVFQPLVDLFFHTNVRDFTAQDVVLSMLTVYLLFFYLQRKSATPHFNKPV